MLQQTQVATVIPYYQRFVHAFPDVGALAGASLDEVMRLWSGLGYYSRARNLHRCARQVLEQHDARFPAEAQALEGLPGIGRSTAAAVAALAYGKRAAILDGNVRRVLSRVFGIEGWPGKRSVEKQLWEIAERELPDTDIKAYTQGLMDLGSTVCGRTRPACARCPVATICAAHGQGSAERLPAPRPARAARQRACRMFAIRREGLWLIEKRPPSGIWGGLWSLPQAPGSDSGETAQAQAELIARRHGLRIASPHARQTFVHAFTHFRLIIEPFVCETIGSDAVTAPGAVWLPAGEVADAALPQPVKRLLRGIVDRSVAPAC